MHFWGRVFNVNRNIIIIVCLIDLIEAHGAKIDRRESCRWDGELRRPRRARGDHMSFQRPNHSATETAFWVRALKDFFKMSRIKYLNVTFYCFGDNYRMCWVPQARIDEVVEIQV